MKTLLTFLISISFTATQAIPFNFFIDMTGQTIAPQGVFIRGQFASANGFTLNPGLSNWTPMPMNDVGNGIWTISIDLPEFEAFSSSMEYYFANGSTYEYMPQGSFCASNNPDLNRVLTNTPPQVQYHPWYTEIRVMCSWGICDLSPRLSFGIIGNQTYNECPYTWISATVTPWATMPSGNILSKVWYYKDGIVDAPEGNVTSGWTEVPPGAINTDDWGNESLFLAAIDESRTYGCFVTNELDSQWAVGAIYHVKDYYSNPIIFGEANIVPSNIYSYGVTLNSNVASYNWSVSNGTLLSGQGSNVVSVAWGVTGPYELALSELYQTVSASGVSYNLIGPGCAVITDLVAVNNDCQMSVGIANSSAASICQGDSVQLTSTTSEFNVTYQWYINGQEISGATSSNYSAQESGNYQVKINQNDCSAVSLIISVTEFSSVIVPSIALEQANQGCVGGEATLSMLETNYSTIQWNNGTTNATSINVTQSGSYFVTVSDNSGCSTTSIPIDVNFAILDPVPVCIVTVDQVSGKNNVVWEPITSDLINSYVILKETNVANEYAQIGTVAYGSNGLFEDINSNPQVQANRYKLALIDTCGIQSSASSFHKTIHLTTNLGVGNNVNLIWSDYEGFDFGSYSIYRGSSASSLNLLTTIASNLNSFTDVNPPAGETYYMIEVAGVSCDPQRTLVYSHSNILDSTVGIEEFTSTRISLYPNPASTSITLQVSTPLIGEEYVVFDTVGKVIYKNRIQSTNELIQLENFNNGNYFIKVNEMVKRFVVQH